MTTGSHRRRAGDRAWWRFLVRENAYRDVWLLLITGLVLWSSIVAVGASDDAKRAGRTALANVAAIQASRVQICREQNAHHDRTLRRIRAAIRQIHDPAQRARAHGSYQSTKGIIDALAPHRDCEHLGPHVRAAP